MLVPLPSSPRANACLLAVKGWLIRMLNFICFILIILQPILSTARKVSNFATQFVKIEAENTQLRKDLSERNRLAEEAWQANEDLKAELAQVKEELNKAKQAEEQRKEEEAAADKALQCLLKGVESLLGKFRIC